MIKLVPIQEIVQPSPLNPGVIALSDLEKGINAYADLKGYRFVSFMGDFVIYEAPPPAIIMEGTDETIQ